MARNTDNNLHMYLGNFTTWRKCTNLERNDKVQEENHVDDPVYVWSLNGKNEKENRADQYPILAEHAVQPRAYQQISLAAVVTKILMPGYITVPTLIYQIIYAELG